MASENLGITGGSNSFLQMLYNQERPGHNQATGTTKKTYTCCSEIVLGRYPVVVGGFGSDCLFVGYDVSFDDDDVGVGAFRKFF